MDRVIERLNMVRGDLRDLILDLTLRNKQLSEIVEECKDDFEVRLLEEDINDNNAVIEDSKIDIDEIEQVIEILTVATEISKIEKRP